jgi:hypothetical protein
MSLTTVNARRTMRIYKHEGWSCGSRSIDIALPLLHGGGRGEA